MSDSQITVRPSEVVARLPWFALVLILSLGAFGAAMLYSTGRGDPTTEGLYLSHGVRFLVVFAGMVVVALMPPVLYRAAAVPAYLVGVALLVAVELAGSTAGGAERWLDVGPIRLQPSEVMKLALVLMLAFYYDRVFETDPHRADNELWHAAPALLMLVPTALVFHQPDLGTGLMLAAVGVGIIFIAGLRWRMILAVAIPAALAVWPLYQFVLKEYQRERIRTFLDPSRDPLGAGYHTQQAQIAIGSGGLEGKGWLQGTQSELKFIPEQHTDFIFTAVAEEFGFIGSAALILVYLFLILWAFSVAARAATRFDRLAATGAGVIIAFYVIVNIGMVIGLLPVVGLPLPLVSHGGTAMLTVLGAFALVLHVAIYSSGRRRT